MRYKIVLFLQKQKWFEVFHPLHSKNAKFIKTYFLVEEDPKDDCSKFDGISHKHRAVCCNKECLKCGGVQGKCGELTDKEGKVLGRSQCCGKRIEKSGITCGKNGSKAPCKLPGTFA